MKLYTAEFNFEVDQELNGNTILFPTLREARTRAVELLRQEMEERTNRECTENGYPVDTLTAKIERTIIIPITAKSLCSILNSNGCFYADGHEDIMNITLPAGAKRPITERVRRPA